MHNLRAIKTVYSYLLPEVRKIISGLSMEELNERLMKSVQVSESGKIISGALDHSHLQVIENLKKAYEKSVLGLEKFKWQYFTAGSEEGIREYITRLKTLGVKEIYMLYGDYEGYKEVALQRGMRVTEIWCNFNPKELKPGYFFISNPSARNGNWLSDGFINDICEAGHKVFLDLTYFGSTHPMSVNVSHPNIDAVAFSFSKPYGLFYLRIGFLFTKQYNGIPSLYSNIWFRSEFSLMLAEKIIEKVGEIPDIEKYKKIQSKIVEQIQDETGLNLQPSHTFLLAHMPFEAFHLGSQEKACLIPFLRDGEYRFCLTPYFIEHEQKGENHE